MTRTQRVSWFLVVLATAVVSAFVVPLAPSWSPSSSTLAGDTVLTLNTATVTVPTGWDIDIAAASQSQPTASLGEVDVSFADAVWLGNSRRLVEHVAVLAFASRPRLPDVPDGSKGADREVWTITTADDSSDDPQRVVVVRQDEIVVLVIVRGPADAVAELADEIDAIVASVSLAGVSLDVDVSA